MATPLPFPGISQTESFILALSSLQLFLSLQPMHIIDKKNKCSPLSVGTQHYIVDADIALTWQLVLLLY